MSFDRLATIRDLCRANPEYSSVDFMLLSLMAIGPVIDGDAAYILATDADDDEREELEALVTAIPTLNRLDPEFGLDDFLLLALLDAGARPFYASPEAMARDQALPGWTPAQYARAIDLLLKAKILRPRGRANEYTLAPPPWGPPFDKWNAIAAHELMRPQSGNGEQ